MATAIKEIKTEHLGIRITPSLKNLLLSQAEKKGLNMTAYLAHLAYIDRMIDKKLLEIESNV